MKYIVEKNARHNKYVDKQRKAVLCFVYKWNNITLGEIVA